MESQLFNEAEPVSGQSGTNQAGFNKSYQDLLAGANRIRYLKTKQKRNQTKMMQYLSFLSKQLQVRNENSYQSTPKMNNAFRVPILNARKSIQFKHSKSPYTNNLAFDVANHAKIKADSQNLFQNSFESKSKNGCFDSKPTEATMLNGSLINDLSLQPSKQKLAGILRKKKNQNYLQMKQLRLKNIAQQRNKQEELLNAARIRRQAVKTSYDNGRKKINQHYIQHLQTIKQKKAQQKESKLRQTFKKYEQLLQLKQLQKEELQKYEQSLIMESNLKKLIEMANKEPITRGVFREINKTFQ